MKAAVIYIYAPSVTSNGRERDSSTDQCLACQKFAGANDLLIVQEFSDVGEPYSKDAISKRQGFTGMLAYCEAEGVHTIIFDNPSRLADDLVVQELIYQELQNFGYTLLCANTPTYFTDSSKDSNLAMIRRILGVVATFQKDRTILKLRSSRERKRAANKQQGVITRSGKGKVEGRKAYGETGDVHELALIRRAKALRKHHSFREVSARLYQEGFTAKKGTPLTAMQIKRIVQKAIV